MNTKIVIIGHGASGKDTLKNRFIEKGLKREISFTTRPPRIGETKGIDYHYVNEEHFKELISEEHFLQYNKFGNGYYYGTSIAEFEEKDVFIMTPNSLGQLSQEYRNKCFVIYIKIDEEIRKARLLERSDKHDAERRLRDDAEDFKDFDDYDLLITNPNF